MDIRRLEHPYMKRKEIESAEGLLAPGEKHWIPPEDYRDGNTIYVRGPPLDQMAEVVAGLIGRRLLYRDLVADNGLSAKAG